MRARARDGGINMIKALRDGRFFYVLNIPAATDATGSNSADQ